MRAETDACRQSLVGWGPHGKEEQERADGRRRGTSRPPNVLLQCLALLPSCQAPARFSHSPDQQLIPWQGTGPKKRRAAPHPPVWSCFCLTSELLARTPAAGWPTPPHRARGHAGAPAPSPSGRCRANSCCDARKGRGEQGGCRRGVRGWQLPQERGASCRSIPRSTQHLLPCPCSRGPACLRASSGTSPTLLSPSRAD